MTPQGALTKITTKLRNLGRKGDRADLDAYMASEELGVLTQLIQPKSIPTIGAAYDKALEAVERRHRPLAPGKHRAYWDAEMVAKLRASWERHGGNCYRIGRDLRITELAVDRAYKRFILAGAAPRKPLGKPPGAEASSPTGGGDPAPEALARAA